MSDIQRWNHYTDTGMQPIPTGNWVTYDDHVAAVAAARAEERQRINSMLVVDYVREQYERGAADKAAELQDYYGEQAQGHYNDGYKMGYAKGLIEGDSGGRKEGFRVGYDTAWSLSAAEIERATEVRVREEEQVAQTLVRAELYSMEEMDERCTQAADEAFAAGVKAARDAIPDNDHRTDLDINDYDTATEYGLAIAKAAIDSLKGDN
jgi:flagellar biosynthesis/type III secretory pathway protein FliH